MVTIAESYASVDAATIGAFGSQVGLSLPEDYAAFLTVHKGSTTDPNGFRAKGWDRGMLVADQFFGVSTGDSDDLVDVHNIYQGQRRYGDAGAIRSLVDAPLARGLRRRRQAGPTSSRV